MNATSHQIGQKVSVLPQWTSLNRFPYRYNGAEYSLPCHQADLVGRSNEIVTETSLNIEAERDDNNRLC